MLWLVPPPPQAGQGDAWEGHCGPATGIPASSSVSHFILPLYTHCVTLGKLLNHSVAWVVFVNFQNGAL